MERRNSLNAEQEKEKVTELTIVSIYRIYFTTRVESINTA